MTVGNPYKVTQKIKLHTKPLRNAETAKTGVFVKETPKSYIFDEFWVKKENIIAVERVGGEWDAKTVNELVKRLKEHYPHSPTICKTIDKVASEMLRKG